MTGCAHPQLQAHAEIFRLSPPDASEGEGSIVVRAVHVKVSCLVCGMPFRFVGDIRQAPEDPLDWLKGGEPWSGQDQTELASWITPLEAQPFLTQATEGNA